MRFPDLVSSERGVVSPAVMARPRSDGSWEGWLEFTHADTHTAATFTTGIETRQHDRVALKRWASGLTPVYAEGALARACALQPQSSSSELLEALREIVAALDRRIPQLDRGSERGIAADAERLRATAMQRIDALGRRTREAAE
jgi:hypothetical protein